MLQFAGNIVLHKGGHGNLKILVSEQCLQCTIHPVTAWMESNTQFLRAAFIFLLQFVLLVTVLSTIQVSLWTVGFSDTSTLQYIFLLRKT